MTQANKPYTFTNGQTADATQVNSDFDTLYTDINGNLDESNIKDGSISTGIAQEGVKPSQTEGLPYAADLFGGSFIVSGGVPTKDGTNAKQINVPAYVSYLTQPDGSLRRSSTSPTSFQVSVANGTYYLDLNPDGTFSWGGGHSTQTNYVPICTVLADGTGNVSTITDSRPTSVNFLNAINETIQASKLNAGQVGGKSVTDLNQSYPTNLFSAFVYTGLTASKDGTTASKLNITAGTAYLLQTDSTLRERDLTATSFTTSTVSTTYYLDLNPDGTWSWGTTHSTVTNYMPICSVATDASGNISTVTDAAQRTANMLPSLASSTFQVAGVAITRATFGTYTGDGTANRLINLGFTPSAVFVTNHDGSPYNYSGGSLFRGGLALNGNAATNVAVATNGFTVNADANATASGVYYYIAFK